jgi:hypothetical protein
MKGSEIGEYVACIKETINAFSTSVGKLKEDVLNIYIQMQG